MPCADHIVATPGVDGVVAAEGDDHVPALRARQPVTPVGADQCRGGAVTRPVGRASGSGWALLARQGEPLALGGHVARAVDGLDLEDVGAAAQLRGPVALRTGVELPRAAPAAPVDVLGGPESEARRRS